MKKLIICLFISIIGYTVNAQRLESDWVLSIGVNALGNLGTRNPVEKLDQFAFKYPLTAAIERKWTEQLSIEQDLSFNGFNEGEFLDNGVPNKDLFYFSTNTNIKWYFSEYLFSSDYVELYASAGVGIFHMDELNTSTNLSGGVIFWVSENIGLRLQSTGKFAINANNRKYANNHWQHSLQVVFCL